jgi:Carboxypeptidase regulatory-like domain
MKKCFLPLILSLLVSSDRVQSQQPLVGLIQGKVIDQKQAPIPYAALTATNIDSVEPAAHRTTTGADEKGFYQFVDLPEGRYSIVVKKTGYRDYKIPVVTLRAGETVKMPDIKMSPRR